MNLVSFGTVQKADKVRTITIVTEISSTIDFHKRKDIIMITFRKCKNQSKCQKTKFS